MHARTLSHRCDECGKRFPIKSQLDDHVKDHHKDIEEDNEDNKEDIGKEKKDNDENIGERRLETQPKQFQCQECGKRFAVQMWFERHVRSHAEKLSPNKDDEDDEIFKIYVGVKEDDLGDARMAKARAREKSARRARKNASFEKRARVKKRERFECDECGREFHLASLLKRHEKTHV